MSKATKVNVHKGSHKGIPALIIDYTIEGKSWINHGIYTGEMIFIVDHVKTDLLEVGPLENRENVLFERVV